MTVPRIPNDLASYFTGTFCQTCSAYPCLSGCHVALFSSKRWPQQTSFMSCFHRLGHRYLDGLPTTGDASGRAFRDLEWEQKVLKICQDMGIGAQFGGKYFCHDVRVIRVREPCDSTGGREEGPAVGEFRGYRGGGGAFCSPSGVRPASFRTSSCAFSCSSLGVRVRDGNILKEGLRCQHLSCVWYGRLGVKHGRGKNT